MAPSFKVLSVPEELMLNVPPLPPLPPESPTKAAAPWPPLLPPPPPTLWARMPMAMLPPPELLPVVIEPLLVTVTEPPLAP